MTHSNSGRGKIIGFAIFALLSWGVVALWSWNTFAVEFLGLPEMAFRHAVAFCLLVFSVGGLLILPSWIAFRGRV